MYYFLVNPASKSNHGMLIWNKIEEYLQSENIEFEVYFSKCPGHMLELMRDICNEHIEDKERINVVILGGDGTFNEAIQGVVSFDKVNIGYIPTGSSNDFARALIFSDDPIENVKKVLSCKEPLKYDIGKLKYESMSDERSRLSSGPISSTRYFNVSCGIGFDAAICEEALNSKAKDVLNKVGLGKLAYALIGVKQIFTAKLCNATLILDDTDEIKVNRCRFIVGMNTCFEGGGYKFAPNAVPDDGFLDICCVGDFTPFQVVMTLPAAQKGTHVKNKKIHTYHVKSFEVITDSPLWVHTDGEVHTKSSHIKVSLIPGGLNFLWG